jgi:hypothetical protein
MKRKPSRYFSAFIALIILAFFVKPMFEIGIFTGVGYLLAIFFAITKRYIFRRNIAFMIILGTLLSVVIGFLIPYALESYLGGDLITLGIFLLIIFLIYTKARKLKKGRR